jgi:hypothetical protein
VEPRSVAAVVPATNPPEELSMGKGILMWLIGIPIPIILLLLLFWH